MGFKKHSRFALQARTGVGSPQGLQLICLSWQSSLYHFADRHGHTR